MRAVLGGSIGLVAYVFAGYPAALAALAKLRPNTVRADPLHTPAVSLIILAFNEEDVVDAKLRNVADLEYPEDRLEVIVVTDGSTDTTPDRARAFPGVKVLHDDARGGKLAAINRGVAAAEGEALVLSDANNHYVPGALRALVAPLADPRVGMVTGRKTIDGGSERAIDRAEGAYWKYESKIKEWEAATGSVVGVCGEIVAFRSDSYQSPEPGVMNEDFMQALLLATSGWRIDYAPAAISVERASATIADEAVRRARLTTGRMQAMRLMLPLLVRRHPRLAWQVLSHKGLRPLVPWALAAAAASNAATVHRAGWPRLVALAQITAYAAAAHGWRAEQAGRRNRFTYLPFYFCRMNAATLRGHRDFFSGRRESTWARVKRG